MKALSRLTICIFVFCLCGCRKSLDEKLTQQSDKPGTAATESAQTSKSYSAKGVIVELVPDKCGAFIHHEEIPGFMEEMTMFLKVANQEEYQTLNAGQQYTFTLIVDREHGTRTQNFAPTGNAADLPQTSTSPSERWLTAPTFELGDKVPDFEFIASSGEPITAEGLKGQTWAITFVFTRCPLPDYCPRMTLRFKEAMDLLEERKATDWKLISLTIDPDYDQLDILKNYRSIWEIDSKNWFFCRTDTKSLKRIGDPLGLSFQTDKFPIEHNLRTAVFDAEGRLAEVFSGNNWTALELANSILRATKLTNSVSQ
ncbi:SCO family protein [Rubripirellula sp.]|nr:SCO family protein [Rubripirellula sp.]